MFVSRIKLNLGFAILIFFSIGIPSKGSHWAAGSIDSRLPPAFSFLPAPVLQATSYPFPTTQAVPSSYPEAPTATSISAYPGQPTSTPGSGVTPTLILNQNGTAVTLTPGTPGTPAPTGGNDIYLTENAEMGQSQATPLPTETPSPSATLTVTLTPVRSPTVMPLPPDEGFQMNWVVFLAAFLGVIVMGGAAWLIFLRRLITPTR